MKNINNTYTKLLDEIGVFGHFGHLDITFVLNKIYCLCPIF